MDPAFRVSIPGKGMRLISSSNGPDLLLDPASVLFKGYTMDSFPGMKQKGRQVHHSPVSNAEVKNEWSSTASPHIRLYGLHGDSPICIVYVYIFLIFNPYPANVEKMVSS